MDNKNETAQGNAELVILTRAQGMELALDVLQRHGFSKQEAETIANHLVEAELRGHPMTGLLRLKNVVLMIAKGRNPIRIVREEPTFAHIDGGGNPAYLAGEYAVELAIRKARENSFAIVSLYNSALGGMSGHYVRLAAEAGYVGVLFSNSYGRVTPYGGIDPLIGTNPVAFGFPGEQSPVVIDVATSVVNNGDVEVARRNGESLPAGAALDEAGEPTLVPEEALLGALLPMGEHKGYAFGLAMQLFGMLAGGDAVPANMGNFGFFFLVVNPSIFGSSDDYKKRVSGLRDVIKGSRRAKGTREIFLPGEGSENRKQMSLRDGFPMRRGLLMELQEL
jgi:LDH2 family malate/lactate/ureidoglycolate dehydrogenase